MTGLWISFPYELIGHDKNDGIEYIFTLDKTLKCNDCPVSHGPSGNLGCIRRVRNDGCASIILAQIVETKQTIVHRNNSSYYGRQRTNYLIDLLGKIEQWKPLGRM